MPPLPQEQQVNPNALPQQAPPQTGPVQQQPTPAAPPWDAAIPAIAERQGVDPELIRRMIKQESGGKVGIRSPKGATGLMQLMPDTAKRYGVDPNDPYQNIGAGTAEIGRLLKKYNGHYGRALAAYNAGEGAVDGVKDGIPNIPETQNYVMSILQGYQPPGGPKQQPVVPAQQGPDLGRFAGYSRIGEAVLRGLRAPGTLWTGPTAEESQAVAQPQQSIQQILETAQRTGQDPEEVARQTSGGRALTEAGISPTPTFDVGAATGAQTGFTGGLAQAASGLTSPSNLAQLFTAIPSKLMALVYAGQMGMDTAKQLWQAAGKYAAGDTEGAKALLGGASVDAVMTALLGRHIGLDMPLRGRETTQPTPRETVQPAGVTQAPSPAEVQVAGRQKPEFGVEGGPQPVTTSGVTAAHEVTGGRVPAAASAPIERGGPTGGAPTQEPGPQEPIRTPISVEERARQTAARAYQEGLFPERRVAPGVSPTGAERRTQAERDYAEAIASTPPGQPTPGEQLSRDIRQARAGQPAGISEGQAMARIMRDPAQYQQFRQSDRKAQQSMLIAAKNALLQERQQTAARPPEGYFPLSDAERSALETSLGRPLTPEDERLYRRNYGVNAPGPAGIPQAQAPTPSPAPAQPIQPRATEVTAGAPGQPLQPRTEPVRQPVRAPEVTARQPYKPLPPEQRPFVQAGAPRKAPELPAYAPAERKPAEIQPGVPATPRPQAGSAEQVEAWKGTRREEAKTREQAMKAEAPYKPKIERSAVGAALDRVLAPPGTYSGDRGAELVQAVNATKAAGPEAAGTARDEMSTRSQKASQMAKWGQDILNAQDLDTALRNKLHEAELGKIEFEGGKMTAGGRWIGGAGKGEGTPTPKVVRQHPNELTAFWNRVRGNAMRVVPGVDPITREPLADISKTEEGQTRLRQYDDELRAILDQVRGNGGQFTQEQEERASTLIAGMNAIRGTAEIAAGGPQARVSPITGALEFTGTKTTTALLNRFMNRPEGAHFKKPSREEIQSRVNEWNREAKWSGDIAKELGTEVPRPLTPLAGREAPAQPPKAPAVAAERPVEAPKSAPAPEVAKPAAEAPKEPAAAKVIPTTKAAGKIARADVPAHAEEVAEIRREREAQERAAEIPAPKPRKLPTPITSKPVSVPSPEAQARYEAEREKVVEKYASERAAHQDRLREVAALRATSPFDYTPEFVDRMARYGEGLKDIEGKHEFLTKVNEARRAFGAGDEKAGHAAVTSALAMADQKLLKPQVGRMPIEPSTGATGAEPPRPGGKGVAAEEQLYNLQGRIGKLAEGEDKQNLAQRLSTVYKRLQTLNDRITFTNRHINEMRKRGETVRTYENREGRKVTETLQQLEQRVMLLGKERGDLASEDIPSLATAVGSFEKAPVAKAPTEVPTKIEPTTVPVYGQRPAYVKGQPKVEPPKIGEKVVLPSPAPKEEGVQARIDELQAQRQHLANLIKSGYGDSRKATELRKTVRRLESSIGIHAPAPSADVAATLEGERLLKAAKRVEPKPELQPAVYAPELLEQIPPADTLHELLKGYEHTTPLVDKLLTADPTTGRTPLGEAADHIARPILEQLKSGDLTAGEAGHRLHRALEVLSEGRKTANQLPAGTGERSAAFKKAFDNAVQIAKEGRLGRGPSSEAGFVTPQMLLSPVTAAGRAVRNFTRRMASSLERNREAQNLSNRIADVRQMNKGDVFHFYEIEKGFKSPILKKPYVQPGSPEEAAAKAPPDIREKIYNYREEQNLPAAQRTTQLSPTEHRVNQFVDNLVSDNTRIIRKLAGNNAPFSMDELAGLTHRVPVGRGQTFEKWLNGLAKVSPGNVLSKFASSRSAARYVAMEDSQTGNRLVVRVSKTGKVYAYGAGQQLGADIGLKSEFENQGFRFGRATSDEITDATGRRYLKDAIGPNIAENIALRRAERIHDFVEALKQEPEFQRMSTTSKAVAEAMGFRAADAGKDALGKNKEWLPQFRGYYFEPHIAEVLERENAKFQKGDFSAYERASNWLKRSIFWNPLMHTPNIAVHWQGEKGLTGMATQFIRPSEWQAHVQAFQVLTDPVKYHQMLEAGLPLMRQPNIADATRLFVVKGTQDIVTNPIGNRLAKAFGYANPLKLGRAIFKASSEITWATHDYAILQATFSRMRKNGWDLKTAADEVTKHIPNYRMPPRVWNSRMLGRIMDTPGISMFSQYHYGAFRSYGEMAKEMVRPLKPGDRSRALDRMAALGFMTYVLYPQLDKLAKHMTGRSTAIWRRAGSSTFVYNVGKLYNSLFRKSGPKMGLLPFAESVVTPAPVIGAAIKAAQSKELTQKGQPLIGTPGRPGVAAKIGQIGAETVGAVAGYESGQLTPGKGPFQWRQFLFRLMGGRDERPVAQRGATGLPGLGSLGKVK